MKEAIRVWPSMSDHNSIVTLWFLYCLPHPVNYKVRGRMMVLPQFLRVLVPLRFVFCLWPTFDIWQFRSLLKWESIFCFTGRRLSSHVNQASQIGVHMYQLDCIVVCIYLGKSRKKCEPAVQRNHFDWGCTFSHQCKMLSSFHSFTSGFSSLRVHIHCPLPVVFWSALTSFLTFIDP